MSELNVVTRTYMAKIDHIRNYKQYIENNIDRFLDLLTNISPYKTAQEEIKLTLETLEGAEKELKKYQPPVIGKMAVFMPSNLILYSYALYLLIPSYYTNKIYFRPSSHVKSYVEELHSMMKDVGPTSIELQIVSQKDFVNNYVKQSNVVVFTGTYQNAEKIKKKLKKDQMYLFFGQGINPFIISENANIEKALQDVMNTRMYNSGQDCLCPDIVYVYESICDDFLSKLVNNVSQYKYGENQEKNADYGPIYYTSTLETLSYYFNRNDTIVHGGVIDFNRKKVEPTVLFSKLEDGVNSMEFYSPVFNVVSYKDRHQLLEVLNSDYYRARAMGASVYGDDLLAESLTKNHTVTVNQTLMDVEDGNKPFGGYGQMSNYINYKRKLIFGPILLSKAIAEYYEDGKGD